MKKPTYKTDDPSFSRFLKNTDHNSLLIHARECMLPDAIADFIIDNDYLCDECAKITLKNYKELDKDQVKLMLASKLGVTEDELIQEYMYMIFSKSNLITMLMMYTDEDTRQDM
ncbi:MAG: hypothetical protein ACK452_11900, partial [Bacteroidota bacterium]